jgi:hypothetical protein
MTTSYKRLLMAIVCCLPFISCKPKLLITENQYIEKGQHAPVPYIIYSYTTEPKQSLLILPSALDSFDVEAAPFFSKLLKKDFQIIVINKPSEGDFYQLQAMDFASQRENEIIKTAQHLNNKGLLSLDSLNILGLDEGAYLAPLVAIQLNAERVIFVNGGPFSPLLEIERLAEKDSLNATDQAFIEARLNVKTKKELFVKAGRVKQGRTTDVVLASRANVYWLSYNQAVLSEIYPNFKGAGHWILFDNYPLNHPKNAQYLSLLNGTRSDKKGKVVQLKGDGIYNAENLKKISDVVESILLD